MARNLVSAGLRTTVWDRSPEAPAQIGATGTAGLDLIMRQHRPDVLFVDSRSYLSLLIEGVAEALELGSQMGIDPADLDAVIEGGGPLDAPFSAARLALSDPVRAGD
jgi:3-hydroxyisobutyrate dehydrogenase-like beta-hydroxyacid dehydrogenase